MCIYSLSAEIVLNCSEGDVFGKERFEITYLEFYFFFLGSGFLSFHLIEEIFFVESLTVSGHIEQQRIG